MSFASVSVADAAAPSPPPPYPPSTKIHNSFKVTVLIKLIKLKKLACFKI
jgi:hypothetical protein